MEKEIKLSEEEQELIKRYRKASEDTKGCICRILHIERRYYTFKVIRKGTN